MSKQVSASYGGAPATASAPRQRQKGGTPVTSVSVRRADNGGFILNCDHERGKGDTYVEGTTLVAATLDDVHERLEEAFGLKEKGKKKS